MSHENFQQSTEPGIEAKTADLTVHPMIDLLSTFYQIPGEPTDPVRATACFFAFSEVLRAIQLRSRKERFFVWSLMLLQERSYSITEKPNRKYSNYGGAVVTVTM
ncbi:MAG: hypothetical protein D6690_02385 [Nitrospirae bacterium]|nr:MAG: hypothetical protein D6690_02385 [Nitrospirota bacterium]